MAATDYQINLQTKCIDVSDKGKLKAAEIKIAAAISISAARNRSESD
jgi:hypothetical protein